MSNLITNGDFSYPNISTNSGQNIQGFVANQLPQFAWGWVNVVGGNVYICDGTGGGAQQYPDVSTVYKTQFLSIRNQSSINQTINITQVGNYHLQFYFAPSNYSLL